MCVCVCVCVCVLVTQSCPTPCDPMHCSPPGSSVHGILQARILEWVAISFSNVNFIFLLLLLLFRILTLFLFLFFLLYNIGFAIHQTFSSSSMVAKLCLTPVTPQTVACQAPLSMGSSRQDHWSGLPFPSPKLERNSCIQRSCLSPFSPFLFLFLSIINIIKEISFQNKI